MSTLNDHYLASWGQPNCTGYVVMDYTGLQAPGDSPVVSVVPSSDIFAIVANANTENRKIAVYPIGACLLDLTDPQ